MRVLIFLSILVLAGCATPVVSDVSDSSVKIQAGAYASIEEINTKAAEACAIYGKQRSNHLSYQEVGNFKREHLYACK